MKVVEIFNSIDGEGKRTGLPVTFIRLFGCNLHCSYCDTRYGCEGTDYKEMSVQEIIDECFKIGNPRITVTGGEPLIHDGINDLLKALDDCGLYEINIETNGSVDITKFCYDNVFFTVDYKCPSSLMNDKMYLDNFVFVSKNDVVKFVVGSEEDLIKAIEIIDRYDLQYNTNVYLSPVFGKIEPARLVQFVLDNHLSEVRVQVQLHKIIWSPDKRGV